MRVRQRGFTLLELAIVAILVGVLAAIALPAYQGQVRKGNRSAAQQFMQDVAIKEQQFLLDTRSYVAVAAAPGNAGFSALNQPVPTNSSLQYTFGVSTTNACGATGIANGAAFGTAGGFTVTAAPTTTGKQGPDGKLCIDSLGNKNPPSKWGL